MIQPWLATAYKELELGIKEIPGSDHNPRIMQYWKYTDHEASSDEVPWCSAGLNYCFGFNGFTGSGKANARSWLKWGMGLKEPVMGCVVILYRGDPKSWKGHVGLFTGWLSPKTIRIISANKRNMWTDEAYALQRVLGWRWPEGVELGDLLEHYSIH